MIFCDVYFFVIYALVAIACAGRYKRNSNIDDTTFEAFWVGLFWPVSMFMNFFNG